MTAMRDPRASKISGSIALIALDLDGTLLRSDGRISERTRLALDRAESFGLTVMTVTARPPRRVRQIADATGLKGLAICSNGGLIYDISKDRAVDQVLLDARIGADLVRWLRSTLPGVRFAAELGMRYGCEPEYVIALEHSADLYDPAMLREDALILCELGVTKLIIQHHTEALTDLFQLVQQHGGHLVSVTHSGSNFIEVAAASVSKALALESYCLERGIKREAVIAFGDMPNDLPMLEWAGHGVAVANAHPDVIAAADEVTDTNDQDGVAKVLERLALSDYRMPAVGAH